jgi:hypothetical protein
MKILLLHPSTNIRILTNVRLPLRDGESRIYFVWMWLVHSHPISCVAKKLSAIALPMQLHNHM